MTGSSPLFAALSERLPAASSFASRVDAVFAHLLIASTVMIVTLTALTLTFLVRYRRRAVVNRAPVRIATWKIETAWTVGTTMVFLMFFLQGAAIYIDMRQVPAAAGAGAINVVGRQWMWDIRYPNGRREFNTMHVCVNRPVRLLLSSEDVIHSFFVPAFRLKQDLVPGKVVDAWFEPTLTGSYPLFCAQYCGTAHSAMIGQVIVLSPAAYAAWLADDRREATEAALGGTGRQLFLKYGCNVCHSPESAVRAPALAGLYGQSVQLRDGTFVNADDQYLHDAILHNPQELVAGYAPVMPSFGGVIAEPEVLELIAYLKTLAGPASTPAPATGP